MATLTQIIEFDLATAHSEPLFTMTERAAATRNHAERLCDRLQRSDPGATHTYYVHPVVDGKLT